MLKEAIGAVLADVCNPNLNRTVDLNGGRVSYLVKACCPCAKVKPSYISVRTPTLPWLSHRLLHRGVLTVGSCSLDRPKTSKMPWVPALLEEWLRDMYCIFFVLSLCCGYRARKLHLP